MKIVVGLGNPSQKYERTLHNLGFMAVDALVQRLGDSVGKRECEGVSLHTRLRDVWGAVADGAKEFARVGEFDGNNKVIFVKPQTYMNLSGVCVREICRKYKVTADNLLVIYDDIDLPVGAVRFRESGSAGTHNGMRSIIDELGVQNFARLRLGAGKPPPYIPLKDYVLTRIDSLEPFTQALDTAHKIVLAWLVNSERLNPAVFNLKG